MYVITGGAGFIGSNLVHALNQRGINDILVVDDLSDGQKYKNLADLQIADYLDKDDFIARVEQRRLGLPITAILHQGACSDTTEWDGQFMLRNNFEYSKKLLQFCQEQRVPFLYASSAAVYGGSANFIEQPEHEKPLNVYGYSKLLFDQYVRQWTKQKGLSAQVAGFRYFNVYGPREQHKGKMASVAFHLDQQIKAGQNPKLFGAYDGYAPGMQARDFIYVGDVVDVNLWFLEHPEHNGIFNLGTGRAEPFKTIAESAIEFHQQGEIEYIDFPEGLKGHYQSYTCADIRRLREVGYRQEMKTVRQGVEAYLTWLNRQ